MAANTETTIWTPYHSGEVTGRIRLSVSTESRTYELFKVTHVTTFPTYRCHSTGLCNYKRWERTCRRKICCSYALTARKYWTQSTVSAASEGCHAGYSREFVSTVEYDQCHVCRWIIRVLDKDTEAVENLCRTIMYVLDIFSLVTLNIEVKTDYILWSSED